MICSESSVVTKVPKISIIKTSTSESSGLLSDHQVKCKFCCIVHACLSKVYRYTAILQHKDSEQSHSELCMIYIFKS